MGPSLRGDVESVDPPGLTSTAGDLWVAFDGQTARLDTANTYRRAVVEIVERCEARDQAAARRITAPWWAFWRR